MNLKPIAQAKDPWLAGALPALRRARRRAEEIARQTNTAVVLAKDGRPVFVRSEPYARDGARGPR
jgi:hypothetical protein